MTFFSFFDRSFPSVLGLWVNQMDLKRRQFLTWLGLTAMGSFNLGNLGCGGRGFSVGSLLQALAQGFASPPQEPFDGSGSAQDRNVELLFQMPDLN